MAHENTLDARRTALAVIDVQEAFRRHIPDFAEVAARCALVAHAARLLGVPVVVTEQYPKGLGRTAAEVAAVFEEDFEPVEKTAFSSCGAQEFVARLEAAPPPAGPLCRPAAHPRLTPTAPDPPPSEGWGPPPPPGEVKG